VDLRRPLAREACFRDARQLGIADPGEFDAQVLEHLFDASEAFSVLVALEWHGQSLSASRAPDKVYCGPTMR
jgi:hypothetical protein